MGRSAGQSCGTGRISSPHTVVSNLDTVKIIALPATNPFAAEQNGTFGAGADNHLADAKVNHRFNDQHQMSVKIR